NGTILLSMTKQTKLSFADKALINFKILLTTEGLLIDIQKVRDKFGIQVPFDKPITDMVSQELRAPEVTSHVLYRMLVQDFEKKDAFQKEIDTLMETYDIPLLHLELFRIFVSSGEISSMVFSLLNETGASYFTSTNLDGNPFPAIMIHADTTIKDIQAEWRYIQEGRDRFFGISKKKQNERKNIDRDLRIYQLCRSGLTGKQIMNKINQEYPGKVIGDSQVYKILAELKKALSSYRRNPRMG
ncbi:MAG: hypothetical protein ACD_80C00106G0003, partial [uncultured bacterium (gcode 4)]